MEIADHLKMQAQIWKGEARAQASTVRECYQACTGATGELGDWNGAAPVRKLVEERDRLRTVMQQVLADAQAQDVLSEWWLMMEEALMGSNEKVRGRPQPYR